MAPPAEDRPAQPTQHALLCGYGRVGRVIGAALRRRGFPFIVIEQAPRIVRRLREEAITVFLGSAANPVILEQAALDRAQILILALADPLAARQVVDYVRSRYPEVDIVARTRPVVEEDGPLVERAT